MPFMLFAIGMAQSHNRTIQKRRQCESGSHSL
jgi:hypothetical protein